MAISSSQVIEPRLDNLTAAYSTPREGLDQLAGILIDLDDHYSKCELNERRILNRALFARIVIDEDEHTTFIPAELVASVIAQTHARPNQRTWRRNKPAPR